MKIKKTFQGELPENRIVNTYSDSLTDAYSANYLNDKLKNVEVSSTEPTNGKDIWVQIGKNLFDKTKIINNLSPTSDGGFTGASGCSTSYVKVNPGDTYIVSSNVDRPWVFNFSKGIPSIGVVATPWNIANGNAFQVIVPDGFEYISFRHLPSSPGEDNINQDIQVEQGEFKTDYEPYIPKKIYVKKDNKYELVYDEANTRKEVYVGPTEPKSGEEIWIQKSNNLFNEGKYVFTNQHIGFDLSNLEIGKTYTFSTNKPVASLKISNDSYGHDSVIHSDPNGITRFTFVMAKHSSIASTAKQYLFLCIESAWEFETNMASFKGFNIQIEEGTEVTKYLPCQKNIVFTKNDNGGYTEMNNEEVVFDGILKGGEVVNVNLNKYKRVYITYRLFDGYGNSAGYSNVLVMDLTKKGSQDDRHTASAVCQYLSGGDFSTIQPKYMSIYTVYDPNHYTFFANFVFDGGFVNGNTSYCVQKIVGVL